MSEVSEDPGGERSSDDPPDGRARASAPDGATAGPDAPDTPAAVSDPGAPPPPPPPPPPPTPTVAPRPASRFETQGGEGRPAFLSPQLPPHLRRGTDQQSAPPPAPGPPRAPRPPAAVAALGSSVPAAPPVARRNAARSTWGDEADLQDWQLYAGGRGKDAAHAPYRRRVDQRGVFAAVCCAVVVAATALPWFRYGRGDVIYHVNLFQDHLAPWLHVIPLVAAVGIPVGIANALLHPTDRGAILVFVLLRVLIFALVVLIAVSIFVDPLHLQHIDGKSATWGSYLGEGFAVAGLFGTAAVRSKDMDRT